MLLKVTKNEIYMISIAGIITGIKLVKYLWFIVVCYINIYNINVQVHYAYYIYMIHRNDVSILPNSS